MCHCCRKLCTGTLVKHMRIKMDMSSLVNRLKWLLIGFHLGIAECFRYFAHQNNAPPKNKTTLLFSAFQQLLSSLSVDSWAKMRVKIVSMRAEYFVKPQLVFVVSRQEFSSFCRRSFAAATLCALSSACHPWGSQWLAPPPVGAWWVTVALTPRKYLCVRICKCVSATACDYPPSHRLWQVSL